jgi:phosphotriesterase-related protein
MYAQTVLGSVSEEKLGITLCHEHISVDLRDYFSLSNQKRDLSPIQSEYLKDIRANPLSSKDNLLLSNPTLSIEELASFVRLGGRTVVECTPIGIGRDVVRLRDIAKSLHLNIIAGTGFYTDPFHPVYSREKNEDELSEIFTKEIRGGVDGSGIKCGIIGEIGMGSPVTENEKKVLRASIESQKKTGAPIMIHTSAFSKQVNRITEILEDEGANMDKVVLGHVDASGLDPEYQAFLAKSGCFIEFDNFGSEFQYGKQGARGTTDAERIASVVELVRRGFISQVLISQDIAFKIYLKKYGGHGYDHILKTIVPKLKRAGLSIEQIDTILVQNPKRLLCFLASA